MAARHRRERRIARVCRFCAAGKRRTGRAARGGGGGGRRTHQRARVLLSRRLPERPLRHLAQPLGYGTHDRRLQRRSRRGRGRRHVRDRARKRRRRLDPHPGLVLRGGGHQAHVRGRSARAAVARLAHADPPRAARVERRRLCARSRRDGRTRRARPHVGARRRRVCAKRARARRVARAARRGERRPRLRAPRRRGARSVRPRGRAAAWTRRDRGVGAS